MAVPNPSLISLTFPAPERLLWVCPLCGPTGHSRIEPSQVFRRSLTLGGAGSSEWRKIQCDKCLGRFMLRINSDGWVTTQAIDVDAAPCCKKAGYSAVDDSARDWIVA